MAHASSLEKSKLLMKKMRKGRAKKKSAANMERYELGPEEYDRVLTERRQKSVKEKTAVCIWDWERKQYPSSKMGYFRSLLKERLLEIKEPQDQFELDEKKKIERILHELGN